MKTMLTRLGMVICVGLLAACGGGNGSPTAGGTIAKATAAQDLSQWENDTYQAAKKEGKVVVYGFWTPVTEKLMTDFMAARYPGVQLETLTSPTATEKLRTEAQTGQRIGDVYLGGQTSGLTLSQLGLSEAFTPPAENEGNPEYIVPPTTFTSYPQVVYTLQGKGILINTQKVPPDKEPKAWKDLLDPFWAGKKIALDHPGRGAGSGPSWARWASEQPDLGRAYLEALAKQDVALATGTPSPSINAVARGEYYAYIPPFPSALTETKGAPAKFIWPGPATHGTTNILVLVKQAPHPNAAKLFMNMVLLPKFQELIAHDAWQTPNRKGVPLPDPIVSWEGHNVYLDNEQDMQKTLPWANSAGKEIFGQ